MQTLPGIKRLLSDLKKKNIKTAVVTSSKNGKAVLEAANLPHQFDAYVDGVISEAANLKGKPEPDAFLYASELMGVKPEFTCVIEDAICGIHAAKAGGFGFVVGIDHSHHEVSTILESGADKVIFNLSELNVNDVEKWFECALPNALSDSNSIWKTSTHKVMLFLDYDGTLTSICAHPDLAQLSKPMKQTLHEISQHCPTAIISGRELTNLQLMVGIDQLIYVGNHGFEIKGPNNLSIDNEMGAEFQGEIDRIYQTLSKNLESLDDVWVEHKIYSLSVHYRQANPSVVPEIETAIDTVITDQLKKHYGKKVFEIRPNIKWDKGKAVNWIMQVLELSDDIIPIYIGDDVTDEDAFKALKEKGIGILVSEQRRPSAAQYTLSSIESVMEFINKIIKHTTRHAIG